MVKYAQKKICLPTALQKKTVEWYHEMLCHPGETRTEHTLRQHSDWKGTSYTRRGLLCEGLSSQSVDGGCAMFGSPLDDR